MQHLAKQKKTGKYDSSKMQIRCISRLFLNEEEDFIYYTNKNGSRAYAQDAPSIQAHTHTHIKAHILHYNNYNRE